jgi:FkbM family methyltransferase
MNILIDVGAHVGETLSVALNAKWAFDHVHSFEPDPACVLELERRFAAAVADGRLTIHPVALGDRAGEVTLFGDNAGGAASVAPGFLRDASRRIAVPMIDVNAFLDAQISPNAKLYIKLNCEGGEVAILDRLCERARIDDIASIMADFDVVRASGGYYQKRRVLAKARARGLPILLAEHVMVGRGDGRLANWFAHYPALARGAYAPPVRQSLKRRLRYFARDMRSALGGRGRNYN